MELSLFFDKLLAVNWVEKDHQRDVWINDGAEKLLMDLKVAIKDAAETFDRIYRSKSDPELSMDCSPNRLTLGRSVPGSRSEGLRHAQAEVLFDVTGQTVTAIFTHSKAAKVILRIDAEDGKVFLRDEGHNPIPDADTASRILLKSFLNGLRLN